MALSGLNWNTTTVINSLEDKNGFSELVKGQAPAEVINFPASLQGSGKKAIIRAVKNDQAGQDITVQVAHVMNFNSKWDNRYGKVTRIFKAPSIAGDLAEIEIDFSQFIDPAMTSPVKMYKLFVYLSVDGANPFYYSNDFYVKGLPFGLEFTYVKGETAADVAQKVYDLIANNKIFQLDTDQLDYSVNGAVLTLTAKETWQRFALVKVAEFGPWDDYSIPVGVLKADKGDPSQSNGLPIDKLGVITCNSVGKNAFGTADQLQQDLRLPTIENLKWGSSTKWQQPIPGATYTQYIITVQAPSNNGGVMAVGERMLSETNHIFWVNENTSVLTDFDAILAELATAAGVTPNPFAKADGDTTALVTEKAAASGAEETDF